MPAIAKEKAHSLASTGAELFEQLSALLMRRHLPTRIAVASEVKKSVRQFQTSGTAAQVAALRLIAQEVVAQIDQLAPGAAPVQISDNFSQRENVLAAREDAQVDAALEAAMHRSHTAMSTPQSVRAGTQERANAVEVAAVTLKRRIENGQLISSGELQRALAVKRQAISAAMKTDRLFAFVGASGENFYPAFYIDPSLDRRSVEKVSKALGSLPAASKYYFFTEHFTALQETPLAALRRGRLKEVLSAAASVVGR